MDRWERREQKKDKARAKAERKSNIKPIWLIIRAQIKRAGGKSC